MFLLSCILLICPEELINIKRPAWLLTLLRFNLTIRAGWGDSISQSEGSNTAPDQWEHGLGLSDAMFWWKVIWWNVSRSKLITLTGENNPQFCWINNFPRMFRTHTLGLWWAAVSPCHLETLEPEERSLNIFVTCQGGWTDYLFSTLSFPSLTAARLINFKCVPPPPPGVTTPRDSVTSCHDDPGH